MDPKERLGYAVVVVLLVAIAWVFGSRTTARTGSTRSHSSSGFKKSSQPGEKAPVEPVNINTANAADLASLPGVGPATAKKIIEYRNQNGPFRSIADLQDIPGFGEQKSEALAPYITF